MGFDGRFEKGKEPHGHHHSSLRGHQGMRLAQLEGRDSKADTCDSGQIKSWRSLGWEVKLELNAMETVNKGKNISLYTL